MSSRYELRELAARFVAGAGFEDRLAVALKVTASDWPDTPYAADILARLDPAELTARIAAMIAFSASLSELTAAVTFVESDAFKRHLDFESRQVSRVQPILESYFLGVVEQVLGAPKVSS